MANPQQTQVVYTKTPQSTTPPSTHRPTPSPTTCPSPMMEKAHTLLENPPPFSKIDNLVISATHPETTPTNKEIRSNPILFHMHIMEIDNALNSFQNLNQQTLLTQLNTTLATNTPTPPSPCPPKSTNTIKNTIAAIVTHVTSTLPITDHALHSFQNSHQPTLHTQLANTPATFSTIPITMPPKIGHHQNGNQSNQSDPHEWHHTPYNWPWYPCNTPKFQQFHSIHPPWPCGPTTKFLALAWATSTNNGHQWDLWPHVRL